MRTTVRLKVHGFAQLWAEAVRQHGEEDAAHEVAVHLVNEIFSQVAAEIRTKDRDIYAAFVVASQDKARLFEDNYFLRSFRKLRALLAPVFRERNLPMLPPAQQKQLPAPNSNDQQP